MEEKTTRNTMKKKYFYNDVEKITFQVEKEMKEELFRISLLENRSVSKLLKVMVDEFIKTYKVKEENENIK